MSRTPAGYHPTHTRHHLRVRLQAALDLLIRLNDRFALDGGAPPSYGGLLWCLGWRDRPGTNGCPTARPTSVMARRAPPGTTCGSACNPMPTSLQSYVNEPATIYIQWSP